MKTILLPLLLVSAFVQTPPAPSPTLKSVLLAQLKIPFEEVIIPMDQPETRASMLKYAPTGKCPSLQDGKIAIWESLAIVEYLAEAYPEKTVWPKGKAARAHARSLASEMHAGFVALRQACPTNFRRPVKAIALGDEVRADVARIEAAWAHARATFGRGGPFLFGRFSVADCFYAPVVTRFQTYALPLPAAAQSYSEAILEHPAMRGFSQIIPVFDTLFYCLGADVPVAQHLTTVGSVMEAPFKEVPMFAEYGVGPSWGAITPFTDEAFAQVLADFAARQAPWAEGDSTA